MAETQRDAKVISKKNTGFPAYLDFDVLRTEGIAHLGNLAGKIWTDHNVHDPGITILEELCYALLDLGYRTNLPVKDLLARNPTDTTPDNNFLTPANILTCNPLTITDFRKLLVDIEGVKNAWLHVFTDFDPERFCIREQGEPVPPAAQRGEEITYSYLNGLYRVYLDLERNIDTAFATPDERTAYLQTLFGKVKRALMEHRNICEDFIEVTVLCKWEVGVCAQVELDAQADIEAVYLALMDGLRNFFSPAPRFYTLTQLLDKDKRIDDIFTGRPRNTTESYGFVDTEEFEALELRKEIHISDVYNVLFTVPGVAKVNSLRLKNCSDQSMRGDKWIVHVPQDHVPDFVPACTTIEFVRNGMPVSFDFSKYEALLQLNREHTGKIAYSVPSPMLDAEIPYGEFMPGLQSWSSIQNDFPRVYGIEKGGLPLEAPPQRIAQARQLQGYLLFFDQLLANYLGQMGNIRELYAMSSDTSAKQTYFTNDIEHAPNNELLIRAIQTDDIRREGSSLATLVSRKELELLGPDITSIELEADRPGFKPSHYTFSTKAERDMAVAQWQEDFEHQRHTVRVASRADQCAFFFIIGSSPETALISAQYYSDQEQARAAAEWMVYAAQSPDVMHAYNVGADNRFSFDVVLRAHDFKQQLQALTENQQGYASRRKGFLQHLQARFAESFTEYAMLSFGLYSDSERDTRELAATEAFLTNYADISSNRGRAFDYSRNGWPGENVSGFEKRFLALIGAPSLQRQSLCNFEIVKYDEKYILDLRLQEGRKVFNTDEKFETTEEARAVVRKIFEAAKDPYNYTVQEALPEQAFAVHLHYDAKQYAVLPRLWPDKADADTYAGQIAYLFSNKGLPGESYVATYSYAAVLKNDAGAVVKRLIREYGSDAEAQTTAIKQIGKISNATTWTTETDEPLRKLIHKNLADGVRLLNPDKFVVDLDTTTIGRPGVITYELLDEQHRFKFRTVNEFAGTKDANDDVRRLQLLLMDHANYTVKTDPESSRWAVFITDGDADVAAAPFNSEAEANAMKHEIQKIVRQYSYTVAIESTPATWSYRYRLGYMPDGIHVLESTKAYPSSDEADGALRQFNENLVGIPVTEDAAGLYFGNRDDKTAPSAYLAYHNDDPATVKASVNDTMQLKQEAAMLNRQLEAGNEQVLDRFVALDEDSLCPYGYRLVDKDNRIAVYNQSFKGDHELPYIRRALAGIDIATYNIPDIIIQGDVTHCCLNGKTKTYHYQIRTQNAINSPRGEQVQPLVLFESVLGYAGKAEAEAAFQENYHNILLLAADESNYGERKPISETEIRIPSTEGQRRQDSIVFIPADTLAFLGTYPAQGVTELIRVIKRYPIRSIRKMMDCEDFSRRFTPCEPASCESVNPCTQQAEKPVYYFTLFDQEKDTEVWQSVTWYETPVEAWNAFRNFLFLLAYDGNFTIQCNCTGDFRLYLRPVLAESIHRFATIEDAWGKNGVQRFINTAQRPGAINGLGSLTQNTYRFFVACPNIRIVHPVQYDTPQRRDEVLIRLYQNVKSLGNWTFSKGCGSWNNVLVDFTGNVFAHVANNTGTPTAAGTYLDESIQIAGAILRYGLVVEGDKVVMIHTDPRTFTPASEFSGTLDDLKDALLQWAFYLPFTRNVKADGIRYCIELRMPGWSVFNPEMPADTGDAAWITECGYTSCEEVVTAFEQMRELLERFENYHPVFQCSCGPYGIAIQTITSGCSRTQRLAGGMLAVSPQAYPYAGQACDAIDQAKALINREGLHLAEHILLRPLRSEDCECRMRPQQNIFEACRFPAWKVDQEDPCLQDYAIAFEPGHDPYSFIATVALPAWSLRFRSVDNRARIEALLQREAPAHVLLRIVWLTPDDMCRYEAMLKRWHTWMAYKRTCRDFDTCELINFLTTHTFACMDESQPCDTCEDNTQTISCVQRIRQEENEQQRRTCESTWFEQVTQLFGWQRYDCMPESPEQGRALVKALVAEPTTAPVAIAAPPDKPETAPVAAPAGVPIAKPATEPVAEEPIALVPKPKFINGRLKTYRDAVAAIQKAKPQNEIVEKVTLFFKAAKPSAKEWIALLERIAKDLKATAKKQTLTRDQANDLIESLIHCYLDKISFNGKDLRPLRDAASVLNALRKQKINLSKVYHQWQPSLVKQYEPDLDTDALDEIFNPG